MEKCGKRFGWKTNQSTWKQAMEAADGNRAELRLAVSMCSACAGDYEDPDRTAWSADVEDDADDDGAVGAGANDFSAEE